MNDYSQHQQNDQYFNESKIFEANVINENFMETSVFRNKSSKALDSRQFICGICYKKYKYRRDLIRHTRSECINCPKNFRCDQCDKAYYRLSHLQDHQKKHKMQSKILDCSWKKNHGVRFTWWLSTFIFINFFCSNKCYVNFQISFLLLFFLCFTL